MKEITKEEVTIPKWLYKSMVADSELVRYLIHHRGFNWTEAIRGEMQREKKYKLGIYSGEWK